MRSDWSYSLLPDDAYDDEVLVRVEDAYHEADEESVAAATEYRHALAVLALVSMGIAVAFLLYDEASLLWMLLVCGALLVFARWAQRRAARLDCHRRFIEFRALAEALRVQAYLRYAGSPLLAEDLLTWTQLEETGWIAECLHILMEGAEPGEPHDIAGCWIEDQRSYHERAAARSIRAVDRSERVVHVAFIASIVLYLVALVFELLCGGLVLQPTVAVENLEFWRAALKITVGSMSAATLLISSYYGKLSLDRVHADHLKMAHFFAWAADRLAEEGQTEALLERLAREELIENGNWYSYQLDNTPGISL
jgi:hypothetical protein